MSQPASPENWTPPFTVGEVLVSPIEFTSEAVRQFATQVGDFNPLHHDLAVAKKSRFGGLIASGAHTTAMMLGSLAQHVTERCASLGLECTFRLRRGVPADITAYAEWTVTAMTAKPSLKGYTIALDAVLRRDDVVFITGGMLILVMPQQALEV